jgi:hypothetical protein
MRNVALVGRKPPHILESNRQDEVLKRFMVIDKYMTPLKKYIIDGEAISSYDCVWNKVSYDPIDITVLYLAWRFSVYR